ncbi:MAG: response regulator transcription factor, partial [Thermomicrobiales bacterium]
VRLPGRAPATLGPAGLTARELQMLDLLSEGLSNKEIAHRLSISPVTVKRHMGELFRKLGVTARADAVLAGRRSGMAGD